LRDIFITIRGGTGLPREMPAGSVSVRHLPPRSAENAAATPPLPPSTVPVTYTVIKSTSDMPRGDKGTQPPAPPAVLSVHVAPASALAKKAKPVVAASQAPV
jgi:hypothetical protein